MDIAIALSCCDNRTGMNHRFWIAASGEELKIEGRFEHFSPDGKYIITASVGWMTYGSWYLSTTKIRQIEEEAKQQTER